MTALEDIIVGCKNGDPAMQKELYDRFSPRFYALCCRYAPDEYVAREMLVDGFTTILSEIGNYRGDGVFEGWMRVIMFRTIVADYRRNRRHRKAVPIEEVNDAVASTREPDGNIDIREALPKALQCLNEKERKAFNMVAIDEYTFREAAELTGMPESTVKSQYYNAREKLKKKIVKIMGRDYFER